MKRIACALRRDDTRRRAFDPVVLARQKQDPAKLGQAPRAPLQSRRLFSGKRSRNESMPASMFSSDGFRSACPGATLRRDRRDSEMQRVAKPVIEDQYETTSRPSHRSLFSARARESITCSDLWDGIPAASAASIPMKLTSPPRPMTTKTSLSASRTGSAVHQILAGPDRPADDVPEARKLGRSLHWQHPRPSDLPQRTRAAPRMGFHCRYRWHNCSRLNRSLVRREWLASHRRLQDRRSHRRIGAHVKGSGIRAPNRPLRDRTLERAQGNRPKSAYLHFLRPNVNCRNPAR